MVRVKAALVFLALVLASAAPVPAAAQEDLKPYTNMIHFAEGERVVGLCYPWLVFTHTFLDLSTWTSTPGIGGDTAVRVECGDEYFTVVGRDGVYLVDRGTGAIIDIVLLGPMEYLATVNDVVALYDPVENIVIAHMPGGAGDLHIPLHGAPLDIAFTVVDGVPVAAYIAVYNDTRVLALANPTHERNITVLPGDSSTVAATGRIIYVEYSGVRAYKIVNPSTLVASLAPEQTIYLPFDLKEIQRLDPPVFYAVTVADTVVEVNLEAKAWSMIGSGEMTPIGVFYYNPAQPDLSTTYVKIAGEWHPVPGYAVARIGNLVFTNYIEGEEPDTVPVLWPVNRTALVATEPVTGTLQVPDRGEVRTIRLQLAPGTYILPRGSVLLTPTGAIVLDKDIVRYPPGDLEAPPTTVASVVTYRVADFPDKYNPVDTFKNVKHVASGAGKLLIVTDKEAVVYAESGVITVIQGTWEWGGVGDKIVLYDGATLRVYDYAGNPVAAYQTYIISRPVYATYTEDVIELYGESYHAVVYPNGTVRTLDFYAPVKRDAVYGTEVIVTDPPQVLLGEFSYTVPRADSINVNKYSVAWTAPETNTTSTWYVLDIANATVYVLLGAPRGELYPLGDYVAYYNGSVVQVLPFKSWVVSNCYVDVTAPAEAMIYVNDRLVGAGSLRYYAKCYQELTIRAEMEYHKPTTETVVVRPGGVNVTLQPEPMISRVTLVVLAPEDLPVESVTLALDGSIVNWRVGEVRELIAGKPYNITVLAFHPFDVCDHPTLENVVFKEGNDTLQIPCDIVGAVLGLKSEAPAQVTLYQDGTPVLMTTIAPDSPYYAKIQPGKYTIMIEPLAEGYVNRTLNVTVPPDQLVVVDVTPYKYSRLIVSSIPPIAEIQVLDVNGTVLATGTGNVTVVVPPGDYQIVATAPGFQQYIDFVTVEPGENKIVNITLVPAQTAPPPAPEPIWKNTKIQLAIIAAVAAGVSFAVWYRKRRQAQVEEAEEIVE